MEAVLKSFEKVPYDYIEPKWKGAIQEVLEKNIKKRKEKAAGKQLELDKELKESSK